MSRILVAVIVGLGAGVLATVLVGKTGPGAEPANPPQVLGEPASTTMPRAIADGHREDAYSRIATMGDIVALPSSFARREALYLLAGRADSARLQALIFDAHAMADEFERQEMLSILFSRLGEIDPRSALALARAESFSLGQRIERVIWRAWARRDLDDALFAAKAETSLAGQKLAAQSLYSAFGYGGNDITERIATELGIEPDRSTRARYIYRLADTSPEAALEFINGLERGARQVEYVSFLADYLARRDPGAALELARGFGSPVIRRQFTETVNREIANDNPAATIEQWLADGRGRGRGRDLQIAAAVQKLASTDLDAARQYFEYARSAEDRQVLGAAIASELAKKSPEEALAWAKENEGGRFPAFHMSVLAEIAKTNPELAMQEALNTKINTSRFGGRDFLVGNVIQTIAMEDPAGAALLLEQIPDEKQRMAAGKQFIGTWAYMDPDAAVDWILRQDDATASQMIVGAAEHLIWTDVDAVIRLLPKVDKQERLKLSKQVAQNIASSRSPAEAQAFIQQFEGQPGYGEMQTSVVAGLARVDVLAARQFADQISSSGAKDQAYQQIIAQHVETNPQEAAQWLDRISDQRVRSFAAGHVASSWHARDPVAAERWLSSLPKGPERDDAILRMSSQLQSMAGPQKKLISSISDPKKRSQAKVQYIYQLMRSNPSEAREMLKDDDIPAQTRKAATEQLEKMESGF